MLSNIARISGPVLTLAQAPHPVWFAEGHRRQRWDAMVVGHVTSGPGCGGPDALLHRKKHSRGFVRHEFCFEMELLRNQNPAGLWAEVADFMNRDGIYRLPNQFQDVAHRLFRRVWRPVGPTVIR